VTVSDINREIVALWIRQFGSAPAEVHWPMISPSSVQANGLTVVGLNPAIPKSDYYTVPLFTSVKEPASPIIENEIARLGRCEASARGRQGYRRYYGPLWDLADAMGLSTMEHVDLFFYRATDQKKFKRLKLIFARHETLTDFGRRQVELAVCLISLSRPKILLVANAVAGRLFKSHIGKQLEGPDDNCLYWLTLYNKRTPVFFLGALSGQGIIDEHSYERLKWHMKRTQELSLW
jgi:hypothetical protein